MPNLFLGSKTNRMFFLPLSIVLMDDYAKSFYATLISDNTIRKKKKTEWKSKRREI